MPTTRNLGGVFTKDVDGRLSTQSAYVSTENVCGLIFDFSGYSGFASAITTEKAQSIFYNGNVVELDKFEDIEALGIDNTVMDGLVKYHLELFFNLAGDNCRLFLSFVNFDNDTNLNCIENMQSASNGIIYQIGVWTPKPFAQYGTGAGNVPYTLISGSDNIIRKLQNAAEVVGGKIGETNYNGNAPLNIILNAPVVMDPSHSMATTCNYKVIPDLTTLECPMVSVVLGQAATDEVHSIQLAMNKPSLIGSDGDAELKTFVPVGNIGATLACLAIAPAEESIAHVANFNLAPYITEAELGFGNLTVRAGETEGTFVWDSDASFTNIKSIKYANRNQILHQQGYIFLRNHDGLEGAIFLSSDQTLTQGDYRTIARGRVIHKARRVVRMALLPYVNAPLEVDSDTGTLSSSNITLFENLVTEAIDTYMVEPGAQSIPQISGRTVIIDENQNVLDTDQLLIEFYLLPIGCTSSIFVTEGFTSSVS